MRDVIVDWLSNESIANTVSLLVFIFVVRLLMLRVIKGRTATLSDGRRRWISVVQNTSILLALLGLVYIWSPQLSTFALSLTAFAVAMVIATKEYLLCIVGALYRATSSPFTVGDWIEVQGLRGEVLTEGILTTKLQELGTGAGRFDYTGRVLTLPNSVLLTQTVFNEAHRKRYLHHRFTVTVEAGADPAPVIAAARKVLDQSGVVSDADAERHWSRIRREMQTDLPARDPVIGVETTALGKIAFSVTVFCAAHAAAALENEVTRAILAAVAKPVEPQPAGT